MAELGTISLRFEYDNEAWANIMNNGQGPQLVTGGTVQLPQGGTRESGAAVTGGMYQEAAEPATGIIDELHTIIGDVFRDVAASELTSDIEGAAERIQSQEQFLTALGRSRLLVYLGECENEDEIAATEQVADSFHVFITCDISFAGVMDEIRSKLTAM